MIPIEIISQVIYKYQSLINLKIHSLLLCINKVYCHQIPVSIFGLAPNRLCLSFKDQYTYKEVHLMERVRLGTI